MRYVLQSTVGVIGVCSRRKYPKEKRNLIIRAEIPGVSTAKEQIDRWLPVVARSHTCVFESRGSPTITCATSSPLFHCKLLAEPRAELYSYHNEKVVPIRDVETHEWLRRAIAVRECDSNSPYKSRMDGIRLLREIGIRRSWIRDCESVESRFYKLRGQS